MGYSADIYRQAMRMIERRRTDAEATVAMRRREVYAKVPQMKAYIDSL